MDSSSACSDRLVARLRRPVGSTQPVGSTPAVGCVPLGPIMFMFFPLLLVPLVGCLPAGKPKEAASDAAAESGGDEATPRKTVGETTQNVLDLRQALADGGVRAEIGVRGSNPLLQSAEAYRTTVAKVGGMAVQQAIAIRNAQSIQDPKPLSHEEFMREIIRPDDPQGIRLAMLPYYQEYAWDEEAQELVVVDFPARKQERERSR